MKVIHLDVGLASSALRLDLAALKRADDLDLVNEGAIAEQAVGQLLRLIGHGNQEPALWYWSRQARSSSAEVDYLAAPTGHVPPIEVTAGSGGAMRSLQVFMAEQKLAWAAHCNSAAPMIQDMDTTAATGKPARYHRLSLPAYAVECLPRLAQEMDAENPSEHAVEPIFEKLFIIPGRQVQSRMARHLTTSSMASGSEHRSFTDLHSSSAR